MFNRDVFFFSMWYHYVEGFPEICNAAGHWSWGTGKRQRIDWGENEEQIESGIVFIRK